MLKEFKEFIARGNIMDMAVGVVIGGAFQQIVTSLVEDIIMPCIAMITGKVDFSKMVIEVGEVTLKYGNFITSIVKFLIIAFSIFIAVKYVNNLNRRLEDIKHGKLDPLAKKLNKNGKKEVPVPEPTVKTCPFCYSEINVKATKCPHCTSDIK